MAHVLVQRVCATLACCQRRAASIAVIGASFDKGQPKHGASLGPAAIRGTGVLDDLRSLGHSVHDLGDVTPEVGDLASAEDAVEIDTDSGTMMRNADIVGAYNKRLSSAIEEALRGHDQLITLGGDHSIAMATVQGHARALSASDSASASDLLSVLWVDAHADINTPLTSGSGNFHGKPVSFLLHGMERYHVDVPSLRWCRPVLQPRRLVYIALRDVDPLERVAIDHFNITAYSMREVDRYGINKVVEMALDQLCGVGGCSLHVSFDIDALDVTEAPSTGTPVRGGLTLREGQLIMEEARASGVLRSLDLVEVNPQLGSDHDASYTAAAARHVLLAACGGRRGGNAPVDGTLPRPQASDALTG